MLAGNPDTIEMMTMRQIIFSLAVIFGIAFGACGDMRSSRAAGGETTGTTPVAVVADQPEHRSPATAFPHPGYSEQVRKARVDSIGIVTRSEEEWQQRLTPLQFDVTRKKGTERSGTGEYNKHHEEGIYRCIGCDNDLFSSETKFESGTGWPSYWAPIGVENVTLEDDGALGMMRTEVLCSRCGAHLGHVFDDGPEPTGLRYCMNSASLSFVRLAVGK